MRSLWRRGCGRRGDVDVVGRDGGIFVFFLFFCVFIPGGGQTLTGQTLPQEQEGQTGSGVSWTFFHLLR